MAKYPVSFGLVGEELAQDVHSDQGILLLKRGVKLTESHILILQRYTFGKKIAIVDQENEVLKARTQKTEKIYEVCFQAIKNSFRQVKKKPITQIDFSYLNKHYYYLLTSSMEDLAVLNHIQKEDSYEEYVYSHSLNVGIIGALIGKILKRSQEECLLIGRMGLFHDIGKMMIADQILNKRSPLTDMEWKEIKNHTIYGHKLLQEREEFESHIIAAALLHHERIDGSGYPHALKEKDIPFLVQIISVADCFDAMLSKRAYQDKKPIFSVVYELVDEIQQNRLNRAIVLPLVQYVVRQYIGAEVELSDGRTGEIVFIQDTDPHQPLVKIKDEYIDLRTNPSLKIIGSIE
ncbi:HD-GYP domain-containing protein [Metabacillus iocasae]|uniref:HD-GYP domain-containing protein (C-di-GMP phosphodiesterase class II) n=1 Tax=Priestia iocasae TaxID=2291674 RepID=A0ABS2QSP3_9BACI|nr:HD-GYP domain-containing protein [Metabacillus iocasae]MBM7702478.1 HD-GYP domain-containing protein (c-di-GMP phosphodiesterase class II) [Metabacillus iocasae]